MDSSSQQFIARLSINISELENKEMEHSDLAMETANKIVDQLQAVMNKVEGLTFKTRFTDPYSEIKEA